MEIRFQEHQVHRQNQICHQGTAHNLESLANSHEYGFYSNVNPNVDHPRWSQAKERRLGEIFSRDTLMFNGYQDQVASLYTGMDLKKYY